MKIYDYKGRKNLCGERVHEARCRLRLTQADLAARLQCEGVTLERDCISRIEIGTRFVTDYELLILARILGVSVNWLLTGEPEKKIEKMRKYQKKGVDILIIVCYNRYIKEERRVANGRDRKSLAGFGKGG